MPHSLGLTGIKATPSLRSRGLEATPQIREQGTEALLLSLTLTNAEDSRDTLFSTDKQKGPTFLINSD